MTSPLIPFVPEALVGELRALIQSARERVAQTVNSELIWLHWQVGARLRTEVLKDERAAYGELIVAAVAAALTAEYGRGLANATSTT